MKVPSLLLLITSLCTLGCSKSNSTAESAAAVQTVPGPASHTPQAAATPALPSTSEPTAAISAPIEVAPPVQAGPASDAPPAPVVAVPTEAEPPTPDGEPARSNETGDSLETRMRTALAAKGPSYTPRTHHHNEDGSPKYLNRLIFESSPYLLQHAHNPVNWYPWGPEAFETAKRENKPILMSVGYATCHWCHVMERESFEDEEVAAFMNQHFICIKVDREERPDVDNIYMTAVNMLHGRGGWPMTIAMTHGGEPFFGGTYFPARDGDRGARKGFLTILGELSTMYRENPTETVAKAQQISQRIARSSQSRPAAGVPNHTVIEQTAQRFLQMHDRTNGGFGRQPKFPRPVTLDFLLRYYRRSQNPAALAAVRLTLDKMANGGLHDQVGGGFHRYTVDNAWLVPHFEKMLYDNAQLTLTYLAAYQITKHDEYARISRRTLDYVAREMTDPGGAFWSATDADSEGEEGLFFVWRPDELQQVLGAELADIAIRFWGVTERGNFEHKNILNVPRPPETVARELAMSVTDLQTRIQEAADKLYEVRKGRIPPLTDDKVLTAWNGLIISAFARGAFVLNEPRYAQIAAKAAEFILTNMRKNGRLLRTFRQGHAPRYNAYLADYAFLAQGLIDLYEATGDIKHLQEAIALHTTLRERYEDRQNGGFFRTSDDHEQLLTRNKPNYDGAQPSGNGIAARNLLRLTEYTGDPSWRQSAERLFRWASARMTRGGPAVPAILGALDQYLDSARQVILVRGTDDAETEALLQTIRRQYLPNRLYARPDAAEVETLAQTIPVVARKFPRNGRTTAYVCEGGVCQLPTSDPSVLERQLAVTRPYVAPAPTP